MGEEYLLRAAFDTCAEFMVQWRQIPTKTALMLVLLVGGSSPSRSEPNLP